MKAIRGMVNGAMNELSSVVSGTKAAAAREHVQAVTRDYISQPRLSEYFSHLVSVVHVVQVILQ